MVGRPYTERAVPLGVAAASGRGVEVTVTVVVAVTVTCGAVAVAEQAVNPAHRAASTVSHSSAARACLTRTWWQPGSTITR